MPCFIVREGRRGPPRGLAIGDNQPFEARQAAEAVASHRYPHEVYHVVEAATIGEALSQVSPPVLAPGVSLEGISPRLRSHRT